MRDEKLSDQLRQAAQRARAAGRSRGAARVGTKGAMQFSCEACEARYLIAEERLGRAGVRVRCKKCGHVVSVRPGAAVELELVEGAGEARNVALAPAPPPVSAPVIAGMAPEWFLAGEGQASGPVADEEVRRRLVAGELARTALVWREGLVGWTPISAIHELAARATAPEPPPLPAPLPLQSAAATPNATPPSAGTATAPSAGTSSAAPLRPRPAAGPRAGHALPPGSRGAAHALDSSPSRGKSPRRIAHALPPSPLHGEGRGGAPMKPPSSPSPAPAQPQASLEPPRRALPPASRPARSEDELLAELGASAKPGPSTALPLAASPPSAQKAKAPDPLLDSVSDEELARELAPQASPPKRSVYVPPAPGSELPERLSPEQVNGAVAARTPDLKQCIADQRAAEPGLKGTLKLRLVIGGDGAVREASPVSEELAKKPIARCVAGLVKEIRFPRSRTGQEVVFPLKF